MIMLSLTRAVTASTIAFAVIQATGCGSRGAAENKGAARLVVMPSSAAANEENLPESISNGAALAVEAGAELVMRPTLVELHHFNVYKNFRAMLDAASAARSNDKFHSGTDMRSDAEAADSTTYFVCSGNSLIKQDD